MAERKWQTVPEFDFKDILYEKRPGVARVTINRPEAYNAFTTSTQDELIRALEDAASDATVGVVVFTGAGDKAFCTGGDAKEAKAGYRKGMLEKDLTVKTLIREMPKPVIAAVNGYAIGGGQVYQQICDLSIASQNAVFGQVGPRVGSPAGGRTVAYLANVIGTKKAREMWMLCRRYNAQEALQMGLINAVFPVDKVDEEAEKWAQELLEMNPTCLRIVRASFDDAIENMPHSEAYFANLISKRFFGGTEQLEAMNAFLEKRKPDWGKAIRGRPEDF